MDPIAENTNFVQKDQSTIKSTLLPDLLANIIQAREERGWPNSNNTLSLVADQDLAKTINLNNIDN